jgi:predicted membrane channel-forming protein YqfA (hemolysin III family)
MKRRLREPISGLTHLVGCLLALVALVVLLTKAAARVDQLVAFGISVSASLRCTGRAPFTIFCLSLRPRQRG